MGTKAGRFVWYDLMTKDVNGAKAFYSEVVGWKTQKFKDGNDYTMWCVGETPIGGFMQLPEEAEKMGAPPHWLAYIETPDLGACVSKAKELGAKVYNEMDMPEVGKFAIMADPQGATFAAFQPLDSDRMHPEPGKVGYFGWNELNTTDYPAAFKFYAEIFGWEKTTEMDMGEEAGTYFMFKHKARETNSDGGMFSFFREDSPPPFWLYYINVDNLDSAIGRVTQNGGKIFNGPMDVPGGKIARCMDPSGAAFALHEEVDAS